MTQTEEISFVTIGRVLIVDDEIEFVKTLKRHLKRQNFALKGASDGCEAMELMAREEGAFDLVVSDVVMPNMDGIQLLEEIKQHHPATSVLLLTEFGEKAMASGAIRPGMDEFHQKPITPRKMLELIRHIDGKRAKVMSVEGSGLQVGSIHPQKNTSPGNPRPVPNPVEEII